MKNQENNKVEILNKQNQENFPKEEKTHIEKYEDKITELSEEEQEKMRAEARERYNRLLGCGG